VTARWTHESAAVLRASNAEEADGLYRLHRLYHLAWLAMGFASFTVWAFLNALTDERVLEPPLVLLGLIAWYWAGVQRAKVAAARRRRDHMAALRDSLAPDR